MGKWIAGYCRGQNLRFTHPCWCHHPRRETEGARYHLEDVSLQSAKGNEIASKFVASAPFHDGNPRVVGVKAIVNKTLERCHEGYRRYLATKHREEPKVRELYHGTNNNILDILYTHGLQPPSDTNASDSCPVSGGKGCAPLFVATLVGTARRSTSGIAVTCTVWASTSQTSPRNRTAIVRSPR